MNSNTSFTDRLDAEYAPAWRPNPGDRLVGTVVGITERTGEFGAYPIVTVRQEDGSELAWHGFHEVARSQLAEARPRLGETLGIKYLGKRDGRYHDYRVVVDRDEPTVVDWSRYASAGGEIPSPVKSDVPVDDADLPTPADSAKGDDDVPF